jgi:hypothetical protein
VSGTSGSSGTSGATGASGTSGTSGVSGTSGSSGTSGASGANGTSGTSGTSGATGGSGTSGTSGTSGATGGSGTSGTSGTSVSVSGTTNQIVKFISSTTVGDSSMSDDGSYVNSPNPMDIVNMVYDSSASSVSVAGSGITIITTFDDANGAWFDYIINDGTSARAGTVMAIGYNGTVQYIDTATADIGTTSSLTFSVVFSGSQLQLQATSVSGTWYVTAGVRSNLF